MSASTPESELIDACINGQADRARDLVAHDRSLVNIHDDFIGSTPLIRAAHRGYREIVELLLEAGADVHARERASNTAAIHWAAEGGHPDIVHLLAGSGAKLDVVDDWYSLGPAGWSTVVTWAPSFHEDRAGTFDLLLSLGARYDPFSAIVRGDLAALRSLAAARPENVHEPLGFVAQEQQPLHFATARGNIEMMKALIHLGADTAALTGWSVSPLGLAILSGRTDAAELLRKAGAPYELSAALAAGDLESAKRKPVEPAHAGLLHLFAGLGRVQAVELLLERGFNIEAEAKRLVGEVPGTVRPIHLAAQPGRTAVVRLLLDKGADINARARPTGQTALHFAAEFGEFELVQLLLERRADRTLRDTRFNATPAEWAAHSGHTDVVELLS
jgi:ankyrin repeat protein